jgi:hypothetical protein
MPYMLLGRIDEMVKAWLSSATRTGKAFAWHPHGIARITARATDFAGSPRPAPTRKQCTSGKCNMPPLHGKYANL